VKERLTKEYFIWFFNTQNENSLINVLVTILQILNFYYSNIIHENITPNNYISYNSLKKSPKSHEKFKCMYIIYILQTFYNFFVIWSIL